MKTIPIVAVLCGFLASCDQKDTSIAGDDKSAGSPESSEMAAPAALPVTEPTDFQVAEEEPVIVVETTETTVIVDPLQPAPTPGQRLDHAIDKTGDGLETAREKTEEGVLKAVEKTGGFLRRAGEAIERKASE